MRSIPPAGATTRMPNHPRYIAYPIKLDDQDDFKELFLSVLAPAALHGHDVADLIEEAVLECFNTRTMLRHSQATTFDLLEHFQRAIDSRGLQLCKGHEKLMNQHDPEAIQRLQ